MLIFLISNSYWFCSNCFWLCSNRLSLNANKTEFLIFRPPHANLNERVTLRLNGVTISESPKIKYLGIILDSGLTWKHHINELCKKLGRSLGMLYKTRKLYNENILRSLYFSLFNSHASYGLAVWGQCSSDLYVKIERIKKRLSGKLNLLISMFRQSLNERATDIIY